MKIGFFSLDWSNIPGPDGAPSPGGAGWYRCILPAIELERASVSTCYGGSIGVKPSGSLVIRDWNKNLHADCDIIVIQRWMAANTRELILRARSTGQIIVNDVDDYYDGLDTRNSAWLSSHPKVNPDANRNHYRAALAASSAITVSTPFLREKMGRLGRPVHLIPNAIDLDRWPQGDPAQNTIGWIGMTAFRSGDLETLRGTIGPWCRKNHFNVFHGGATKTDVDEVAKRLDLGGDTSFRSEEARSIFRYPEFFTNFGIGIVPLNENSFNEAKSFIKGLEYAAAGLPFVATDTTEYSSLASRGIGRTASRPKDWIKQFNALLDPEVRVKEGARNRERVAAFDIKKRIVEWRDVYAKMPAEKA